MRSLSTWQWCIQKIGSKPATGIEVMCPYFLGTIPPVQLCTVPWTPSRDDMGPAESAAMVDSLEKVFQSVV